MENVIVRCSPRSLSCTDIAGSLTDPYRDPVDEKRSTVSITLHLFSSTVGEKNTDDVGRGPCQDAVNQSDQNEQKKWASELTGTGAHQRSLGDRSWAEARESQASGSL